MAYLGNTPGVSSQRSVTTFTATSGQTTFTPQSGYSLGYLDVYLNGVKLVNGDDYTASNGTSFVLTTGANAGDSVESVAYLPRGLSDGYLKSEADARFEPIDSAYTKAEADAKYVELAGDTMSGNLITTGEQLQVSRLNGNMARLTLANTSRNWTISNYGTQFGTGELAIADETAGAIRMTFEPSGAISIPRGQLRFPATQVASSDPNTLDDYEEGTWTPNIFAFAGGAVNPTFTGFTATGTYTKVGALVTLVAYMSWTGRSGGAGLLAFGGLPFGIASDQSFFSSFNYGQSYEPGLPFSETFFAQSVSLRPWELSANSTIIRPGYASGGRAVDLSVTELRNASSVLKFVCIYQAS